MTMQVQFDFFVNIGGKKIHVGVVFFTNNLLGESKMRREKRKEVRTTLGTEEDGNESERREDFSFGIAR